MQRYLIFDEVSKMLKGFLEVPTSTESETENIGALEGVKVRTDDFPILAEGTTLQLNGNGTWGVVALPVAEAPL